MSADSRTVCPKCDPDIINYIGVLDNIAEEREFDRSVRENIDYYLQGRGRKLVLVFEYRADCWICGWHFDIRHEDPIPLGSQ